MTSSTRRETWAGSRTSAVKLAPQGLSRRRIELRTLPAGDRDPAALGRQLGGDGEANAAAAAGDERYFICQAEVHAVALTEDIAVITAVDADRAAGNKIRAVGDEK